MLRQPLLTAARYALIAVGLLAAVNTVLWGNASSPAGGDNPNPYSPEYGWQLHEWAVSFAVASIAFAAAIVLSRGWSRLIMIAVLLLTWSNGVAPGWHLLDYYRVSHRH